MKHFNIDYEIISFKGGYIWGAISDVVGRKRILFVCLIFNGLFGTLSGLSQSYHTLLIMRFFSGLGYKLFIRFKTRIVYFIFE